MSFERKESLNFQQKGPGLRQPKRELDQRTFIDPHHPQALDTQREGNLPVRMEDFRGEKSITCVGRSSVNLYNK
jgi:hypothetical protein